MCDSLGLFLSHNVSWSSYDEDLQHRTCWLVPCQVTQEKQRNKMRAGTWAEKANKSKHAVLYLHPCGGNENSDLKKATNKAAQQAQQAALQNHVVRPSGGRFLSNQGGIQLQTALIQGVLSIFDQHPPGAPGALGLAPCFQTRSFLDAVRTPALRKSSYSLATARQNFTALHLKESALCKRIGADLQRRTSRG